MRSNEGGINLVPLIQLFIHGTGNVDKGNAGSGNEFEEAPLRSLLTEIPVPHS